MNEENPLPKRRNRSKAHHIVIPEKVLVPLQQASHDHDLSLVGVAILILEAAFRTGMAERLILNGLEQKAVRIKRRGIPHIWDSVGSWRYEWGEYALQRQGPPHPREKPENGWYLEGPGLVPTLVGKHIRDAQLTATAMVTKLKENGRDLGHD